MRRVLTVAALALLALPASASGAERYVALGDSFTSGVGTARYTFSLPCLRGPRAYPAIIDRRRPDTRLVFRACAAAQTRHVLATQVSSLTASTDLVTVGIGGNDVGFAKIVLTCSFHGTRTCVRAIERAEASARETLPGRLDRVYEEIKRRSPGARVVVLGYPRLFGEPRVCDVAPGFNATEQRRVNGGADALAGVIRARARAHGFRFVDPRRAFRAHGICDADAWINGVEDGPVEAYHPNRRGHAALSILVRRALG